MKLLQVVTQRFSTLRIPPDGFCEVKLYLVIWLVVRYAMHHILVGH